MPKMNNLKMQSIQSLLKHGNLIEAKNALLEILNDNPKNVTALHMLSLIYVEINDFENAREYIERALELDDKDPTISLNYANILKNQGLFNHAQTILKKLTEQYPNMASAYNNLGTVYFAQAKLNDAIAVYKRAIDLKADYNDAYYNLGLALSKSNKVEEAINAFESLNALIPDHPACLFQLALLWMKKSQYEKACSLLLKVAETYSYHTETFVNLGTCYLRLRRLDEAERYYRRALEVNPKEEQALFNLGVIASQKGLLEEANGYYLKVTELNPKAFEAQNNLAFNYLTMQKTEDALRHFKAAAAIQPNNVSINHTIHILSGDKAIKTSPPEYITALFDSYADHFDQHLQRGLQYQVPKQLYQTLKDSIAIADKQFRILDIGCGTGLCGEIFKPLATHLVGIDLSGKMLEAAANKRIYDELMQTDIEPYLASSPDSFDLIIAGDVLVYIGELDQLFTKVNQALKQDGLFLFNTEIGEGDAYQLTPSGRFAHQQTYLEKAIAKAGLSVLTYKTLPMRTQNKKVVYGHVFLCRKKS